VNEVIVRDPLWDTIRLDPIAVRIVDAPAFQRLRHIKQLGHAHLVYPGATHTRFDHALGVYHLARRALDLLGRQGDLQAVNELDIRLIPLAGLLHDIGHYPFSHALEELQPARIPEHHEALASRFFADAEVGAALREVAADAASRVEQLIRGEAGGPLGGLVSGSLDLDKIEYLKRDAHFCGVPYGQVDVDRLLHALTLVSDPDSGQPELAVREKGVAALESLLFSKYQMFRNVYWHHAVRAATVLYKRIVADAMDGNLIEIDDLIGETDEGVMFRVSERARTSQTDVGVRVRSWIDDLRARRLPKRAGEIVAADLEDGQVARWIEEDAAIKRRVEDRIAADFGLGPGNVFLDYPEKSAMFSLDLLVQRRDGSVFRLGPTGRAGLIGLPSIADELYRSARVLRLFTHGVRRVVTQDELSRLVSMDESQLEHRLATANPLLTGVLQS
jgi:hypothetical protein